MKTQPANNLERARTPMRSAECGVRGRILTSSLSEAEVWMSRLFQSAPLPSPLPALRCGAREKIDAQYEFQGRFGARNGVVTAFTLIELIVALAIAAIVLASINAAFFSALHMRNRASDAATQTLPVDMAISIMKRDLNCIVPAGILAGQLGTDAVNTTMTQPLLLELFSSSGILSADMPYGDVQKIDYYMQDPPVRRRDGGRELIRGVTRNLLASTPAAPEPQILLDNVQNLQLSFYDGTNWTDTTWSTTLSNLPVAIRVNITFVVPQQGEQVKAPVQFLVPIVTYGNTNTVTNSSSTTN